MKTAFGVYVHWPFCLSKCPYCDFNSHVRQGGIDETRYVAAYAAEKSLALPADFMRIAAALKKDISDYRDYEIAHEKSPRRLSGTVFDTEGRMQIAGISLYPTKADQQVESKVLHDLMRDLDTYIALVIELVRSNGKKTKLKRKES